MTPAHVVLVDDDALIRRFVEMCLEDAPVRLSSCAGVDEALALLERDPAQLLITDLMMPGKSGFDLLAHLAAEPTLRGNARLVVFSAGLDSARRVRLAAYDIWRELPKPLSVNELLCCVSEATEGDAAGEPTPERAASCTDAHEDKREPTRTQDAPPTAPASSPGAGPAADGVAQRAHRAIAEGFGGHVGLYTAFRDNCREQFPLDLSEGDSALREGDFPTLRRSAHNLKSALRLLAEDETAAHAARAEQAAAAQDRAAAEAAWQALAAGLRAWLSAMHASA